MKKNNYLAFIHNANPKITFLLFLALMIVGGRAWGQADDDIASVTVDGTTTYYKRMKTDGTETGALNFAASQVGTTSANVNVVVELLKETSDYYTLGNAWTFNKNYVDITIRTKQGESFTSTLTRGYNNGRMFSFSGTNSSLTLENIIIDGGYDFDHNSGHTTTGSGGILYVGGGIVNINSGAVLQNSKSSDDGGILHAYGGTVNINSGATLQNSMAADGGIASVTNNGTLVLNGGTLRKGLATSEGGGVYLNGANAHFTMNSGTITECEAQKTTLYVGGGICVLSHNFEMNGGTISHCHAAGGGGAIGIGHDYYPTINDGLITDCTAGNHGGAIEIHGGLYMNGGTITHCHSDKGGAINFWSKHVGDDGWISVSGSTKIYDNTVEIDGVIKEANIDIYNHYNNTGIKTTAIRIEKGKQLNSDAIIGVYSSTNNEAGQGFASYITPTAGNNPSSYQNPVTDALPYLSAFRNDNKGGLLLGTGANATAQGNLVWREADPIVRVQRNDNPTWQYFEHLFTSGGMGAFNYIEMMSDEVSAVTIETLKETHSEYTFTQGYTFSKGFAYTLKTVEGSWEGLSGSVAAPTNYTTIARGYTGGSLFMIDNASTSLTIEKITLDGGYDFAANTGYTCSYYGGLLYIYQGSLNLNEGATLQNSLVSNRGGGGLCVDGGTCVNGTMPMPARSTCSPSGSASGSPRCTSG